MFILNRDQKEGILFDVGHGQGSFDWKVAEAAALKGFWPNLISTDLHSGNVKGAAKDLCYVMNKFLTLGMSFEKVPQFNSFSGTQHTNLLCETARRS